MSEKLDYVHHGSNDSQNKFSNEEQIEQREIVVAPARAGKFSKVKRHCARFWWVHLIVFCLIFLIIALCLVYVAMPKIAQNGVNDSHMEVTEFQFLNPSMETVTLTQRVILHSPSIYTPTLDTFAAASYLVTNGTFGTAPIINVQMPEIHALHPQSNASVVGQVVRIADMDQLTEYATQVIARENVTTALVGKTKLHEGKLPVTTVNYNSSSTYKTLNGLAGFNVTNVKINITKTDGGPNLSGFAYVPNPSVMTIEMGNVTLSLSTAKNGIVGTTLIENFTLKPGNNTFPMIGTMNQTLVLDSLVDGFAELSIKGQSVVYNGVHLTYYEKALSANALTLKLNVQQIVKDSLTG